jgi:hypothetical protein
VSVRASLVAALALAAAPACGAPAADAAAPSRDVRIVVDEGDGAPRGFEVQVAPGASALDATRAAVAVEQGWVCCSDADVWSVGGLPSDPARDGWWSWLLDGELGPGFAHQVELRDGATVTWRYTLGDLHGGGAPPVARVAALEPSACAALEAFGAGRNLVAHGAACALERHAHLPRLARDAPERDFEALELDALVDGPALAGVRALTFAPGSECAAWEALGALCGRRAAARAACGARLRAR